MLTSGSTAKVSPTSAVLQWSLFSAVILNSSWQQQAHDLNEGRGNHEDTMGTKRHEEDTINIFVFLRAIRAFVVQIFV
jgi:hypothetical protein